MIWLFFQRPIRTFRLMGGFCPICNSSPPDQQCFVCEGNYDYGPDLPRHVKDLWFIRFRTWCRYNGYTLGGDK